MRGTGYASLFLNPCASVYTQLGQSCSAATRLSLHIPFMASWISGMASAAAVLACDAMQ